MRVGVLMGHFAQEGGYGGGEKHAGEFVRILDKYYDVELLTVPGTNVENSVQNFKEGYNIDLSHIKTSPVSLSRINQFDVYININHGWLLPPLAKRNIIVVFYPQYPWNTSGYDTIIANSEFVKEAVRKQWGRDDAVVIYPPIDTSAFKPLEKRNSIVTVGRFFEVPDGNNKNHELMIECFKQLPEDFEFHIVGTIQNQSYYSRVREAARDCPRIYFHHDITLEELVQLYGEAKFYWHAAGYNAKYPSMAEHFGMSLVEAMAAGCVPITYNLGGALEIGIPTWSQPPELVERTLEFLCEDPAALSRSCVTHAQLFSSQEAEKKLLKVMESPIVIYPVDFVEKEPALTPTVEVSPKKKEFVKVGWIGDSPYLTTGFGLVAKMICEGLVKGGHSVACLGMYDTSKRPRFDSKYPVWQTPENDPEGFSILRDFLQEEKPEVLIINYDPGKIIVWLRALEELQCKVPVIAYFPIEGWPIAEAFTQLTSLVAKPVTYLDWAAKMIEEVSGIQVEAIPHGSDHAPFERFDEERRQQLKRAIGWENKFCCGFVGRNKRTKQHPKLIIALAKLKEKGIEDIRLYLHCSPFENFMMHGWDLLEITRQYGVENWVRFSSFHDQRYGVSYTEPGQIDENLLNLGEEDPNAIGKIHKAILDSYTMIERYNLMDLFISPSQVEGFGLPTLEAMACGVPVVVPKDGAAQEEVVGDAGILVRPVDWDTWFTGALLANVAIDDIVAVILKIKFASKDYLDLLSLKVQERASQYKWKTAQERFCEIVREVL